MRAVAVYRMDYGRKTKDQVGVVQARQAYKPERTSDYSAG